MTLAIILASIPVSLLIHTRVLARWRTPLLLVACGIAVFALQPALPIRGMDFWLPLATLGITCLAWAVTAPREVKSWRKNWSAAAILAGVVLVLGLTRLVGVDTPLTASTPPQFHHVIIATFLSGCLIAIVSIFQKNRLLAAISLAFLLLLFIILKNPQLATLAGAGLRQLTDQAVNLASDRDIRWLGYSYIAFRLIHTLRDYQAGRLPGVSLSEFVIYVLFFPALPAGPIDRIERFTGDLRNPTPLNAENMLEGGKRIALGLFKKFVLADLLSLIALNETNALQVSSPGWAWVLLYAYAFNLLLDFSGYTDITIGLGRLMGIRLPENFKTPYLKSNLTQFWNNWHMTLTQWFRAYFFFPVTRAMRSAKNPAPIPMIILITQFSTMVLIGLWHGITLNFAIWGAWHGLGLFIQNQWSEKTKRLFHNQPTWRMKTLQVGGILLTFHFVTLGWVFFALPGFSISLHFFATLFGA